jgi:ribosome-binding factor A
MSFKCEKVAQEILELMTIIFSKEVRDPRLDKFITVTEVEVTRDLSHATIYISKIASDRERKEIIDLLNRSKGFYRSLLSKRMHLRSVPELHFKLDNSLVYGQHIEEILAKVKGGKEIDG